MIVERTADRRALSLSFSLKMFAILRCHQTGQQECGTATCLQEQRLPKQMPVSSPKAGSSMWPTLMLVWRPLTVRGHVARC